MVVLGNRATNVTQEAICRLSIAPTGIFDATKRLKHGRTPMQATLGDRVEESMPATQERLKEERER